MRRVIVTSICTMRSSIDAGSLIKGPCLDMTDLPLLDVIPCLRRPSFVVSGVFSYCNTVSFLSSDTSVRGEYVCPRRLVTIELGSVSTLPMAQ